jgi:hypothetical protein
VEKAWMVYIGLFFGEDGLFGELFVLASSNGASSDIAFVATDLKSLGVLLTSSVKDMPTAASTAALRRPIGSRSQFGIAAEMEPLMACIIPNVLIVAQGRPPAPRAPKLRASALLAPIKVASAEISTCVMLEK